MFFKVIRMFFKVFPSSAKHKKSIHTICRSTNNKKEY